MASSVRARVIPVLALVCLAALLTLVELRPEASAAPIAEKAPHAAAYAVPRGELKKLVKGTKKLKKKTLPAAKRAKLIKLAGKARAKAVKKPCQAVSTLGKYRRVAASVKVQARKLADRRKTALALADLVSRSTTVSLSLMSSPRATKCGGGPGSVSTLSAPKATVLKRTPTQTTMRIQMPQLRMTPVVVGKTRFTRLDAAGTQKPTKPGRPWIPMVSELFAVPSGASVSLSYSGVKSVSLPGVRLFPTQPGRLESQGPPDFTKGVFAAPKFVPEKPAPGVWPRQVAAAASFGKSRDTVVGGLGASLAQYNAGTDTLKVISEVTVVLRYSKPAAASYGSVWEAPNFDQDSYQQPVQPVYVSKPAVCGEEMLIIGSPDVTGTIPVMGFAKARKSAGYFVRMVNTGDDAGEAGTTATDIQRFIRFHLNSTNCVRPSYIVLLGDETQVPTYVEKVAGREIPSDFPYSLADDKDLFADVRIGRILGADATAIGKALDKTIDYGISDAIGDGAKTALVASNFQDDPDPKTKKSDGVADMPFFRNAEEIATGLGKVSGVEVDRIYTKTAGSTPAKYEDGTALPASLTAKTFKWDGSAAKVVDSWSKGRFLVVHRDHGYQYGWGEPAFNTGNVGSLKNRVSDGWPVLLSINCSSGHFDGDDTSFIEAALSSSSYGAVAGVAATRDSWSYQNGTFARAFVDALLPQVIPNQGPANRQRLSAALNWAQTKVASESLVNSMMDGGAAKIDDLALQTLYLFQLFGDPTLRMKAPGRNPLPDSVYNQIEADYGELVADPGTHVVDITLPRAMPQVPITIVNSNTLVPLGRVVPGNGLHYRIVVDAAQVSPGLALAIDPPDRWPYTRVFHTTKD